MKIQVYYIIKADFRASKIPTLHNSLRKLQGNGELEHIVAENVASCRDLDKKCKKFAKK